MALDTTIQKHEVNISFLYSMFHIAYNREKMRYRKNHTHTHTFVKISSFFILIYGSLSNDVSSLSV